MVTLPNWTGTTEERMSLEKELDEWSEGGKILHVDTDKEHMTAFVLVKFRGYESAPDTYSVLRGFTMHGMCDEGLHTKAVVSVDVSDKTADEALKYLVEKLAKEWH